MYTLMVLLVTSSIVLILVTVLMTAAQRGDANGHRLIRIGTGGNNGTARMRDKFDRVRNMAFDEVILQQLKAYGVGHRKLDDDLFSGDKPPPRLGIYDLDEEDLCHEVIKSTCNIPGCTFSTVSLLEFENHYNASHRYSCSQCKKVFPSPHFLDLHIQEKHDSFFAVMAEKKPSYCCYIEECKEKFLNADERLEHCVKIHKLPKDFRFDPQPRITKMTKTKRKKKNNKPDDNSMDLDNTINNPRKEHKFTFNNSKQKTFVKYTGKKFTNDTASISTDVNMDNIMDELKESLP